jgi:hypothetical protein
MYVCVHGKGDRRWDRYEIGDSRQGQNTFIQSGIMF